MAERYRRIDLSMKQNAESDQDMESQNLESDRTNTRSMFYKKRFIRNAKGY